MAMRSEKPDTTRQSEGFDQVHTGLTVGQIAVQRAATSGRLPRPTGSRKSWRGTAIRSSTIFPLKTPPDT